MELFGCYRDFITLRTKNKSISDEQWILCQTFANLLRILSEVAWSGWTMGNGHAFYHLLSLFFFLSKFNSVK